MGLTDNCLVPAAPQHLSQNGDKEGVKPSSFRYDASSSDPIILMGHRGTLRCMHSYSACDGMVDRQTGRSCGKEHPRAN